MAVIARRSLLRGAGIGCTGVRAIGVCLRRLLLLLLLRLLRLLLLKLLLLELLLLQRLLLLKGLLFLQCLLLRLLLLELLLAQGLLRGGGVCLGERILRFDDGVHRVGQLLLRAIDGGLVERRLVDNRLRFADRLLQRRARLLVGHRVRGVVVHGLCIGDRLGQIVFEALRALRVA